MLQTWALRSPSARAAPSLRVAGELAQNEYDLITIAAEGHGVFVSSVLEELRPATLAAQTGPSWSSGPNDSEKTKRRISCPSSCSTLVSILRVIGRSCRCNRLWWRAPKPGATGARQTTISVSGAFALFPLMTVWAEEYQKLHPEVRFDVQAGGAGKGMTDMLAGAADIAMLSREPRQEELDQRGLPRAGDDRLSPRHGQCQESLSGRACRPRASRQPGGAGIWFDGSVKTLGRFAGQRRD